MALDPRQDLLGRVRPGGIPGQAIADLQRRVTALEQNSLGIQITAGTPTSAPRDGTLAGDSAAVKLWLRVNGGWHFTTLT